MLGVPIFVVDPKNTSMQCPNPDDSILTKEIEKQETSSFQCLQCGFTAMADYVGQINKRL